jgi:hypothetical protein
MNQALLSELQSVHSYPCVTVLINTTPGKPINEAQGATVLQFVDQTRERLLAEVERVPGSDRENLVVTLLDLLRNVTSEPPSVGALCLCGSCRLGSAGEAGTRTSDY